MPKWLFVNLIETNAIDPDTFASKSGWTSIREHVFDTKLCLSVAARKMGTMLWQIERQREDLIKGLKETPSCPVNEIQS